jgi:very-short-patch-repair endonuclease
MAHLYNHPHLKAFRRRLRREQTLAEKVLWSQLRGKRLDGLKFFRQNSVGPYVLDFYCTSHRLAIELDGPDHFEGNGPEHDRRRTRYLNGYNIRVIRFTNDELFSNPNTIIDAIRIALKEAG